MKKQPIIRILLIAVIALSTVFMVAAFRSSATVTAEEECILEDKNDCPESKTQSEFLLQSLTRTLLDG